MTDEQLAAAKVKVIALPTVLGAVVPVYNIPGVSKELNFSGDVIADIYLGKIATWNDPRIAKDNPGVNLPNNAILPGLSFRRQRKRPSFLRISCPRSAPISRAKLVPELR